MDQPGTSNASHDVTARALKVLLTPNLTFAEVELTTVCPCRCVTCGSNCGRAADNELTGPELQSLVDDLHELGCKRIAYLGGEPLCRPELLALIRQARGRRMLVEIVTSGMGLDSAMAVELKAAGINSATVSIDGLEAAHDMQRGVKGSFRRALAAIAALKAAKVPVGVNTQVNRASMPELESMGDVLLEAGAIGWQLQTTFPMGRAASSPLVVNPSDMPELLAILRRLALRPKLAPHLSDAIGWWTSDDTRLRSTPGGLARCWLGCVAGIQHMGVTSQGNVKGCLALSDAYIEGNIREQSLDRIWHDEQRFTYNRAYQASSLSGSCSNCSQATLCRGGCTASSVAFHGKPGVNENCLRLAELRGK